MSLYKTICPSCAVHKIYSDVIENLIDISYKCRQEKEGVGIVIGMCIDNDSIKK